MSSEIMEVVSTDTSYNTYTKLLKIVKDGSTYQDIVEANSGITGNYVRTVTSEASTYKLTVKDISNGTYTKSIKYSTIDDQTPEVSASYTYKDSIPGLVSVSCTKSKESSGTYTVVVTFDKSNMAKILKKSEVEYLALVENLIDGSLKVEATYTYSYTDLGTYLDKCKQYNWVINPGLTIKIPVSGSNIIDVPGLDAMHSVYNTNGSVTEIPGSYSVLRPLGDINDIWSCYFIKYKSGSSTRLTDVHGLTTVPGAGSVDGNIIYLPVYPTEFSDQNSSNFSPVSLLGRSVDYQVYNGSSRSVSFNLTLHAELMDNYYNPDNTYDPLRIVVAEIESCCYPAYESSVVKPPEIAFHIGNISIRGILDSVSANWKLPVVHNRMQVCELSINIKETTGPYSMDDVARLRGKRSGSNEISMDQDTGTPNH